MTKPKLENFIKEIPWTDSQGKERKAAGIDFASYAFALEKHVAELEKTSGAGISVHIVAEVYGGVLNEISAFSTKEKAEAYAEDQAKTNDFHKDSDDHWTSRDEDDDMTLWTVKLIEKTRTDSDMAFAKKYTKEVKG